MSLREALDNLDIILEQLNLTRVEHRIASEAINLLYKITHGQEIEAGDDKEKVVVHLYSQDGAPCHSLCGKFLEELHGERITGNADEMTCEECNKKWNAKVAAHKRKMSH